MDRYTQLALVSAAQAVKDSGMDLEKEDKNRIGVIFGVGIGGIRTFEDEVSYYAQNKENGPKFNPFFIPKMISDIAAGQISIHYGFRGPNYATTSACASSTNALADAFNLIRLGKAQHHRKRWSRGCHLRLRRGRLQRHARALHTQRRACQRRRARSAQAATAS